MGIGELVVEHSIMTVSKNNDGTASVTIRAIRVPQDVVNKMINDITLKRTEPYDRSRLQMKNMRLTWSL